MKTIYIHDFFSISAAGNFSLTESNFGSKIHFEIQDEFALFNIHPEAQLLLETFLEKNILFKKKSRTIQLTASVFNELSLDKTKKTIINIGSSRGNSDLWEKNYSNLLLNGKVSPSSSPETTTGSISSSLIPLVGNMGIAIDHSVTCGSGLQAVANASAWLLSGMAEQAVVGGSEAPLTPFTLQQFKAMGIYSKEKEIYPSRPLAKDKKSTYLCLGEGSGLAVLRLDKGPYYIAGIGFGTEETPTLSGISENGKSLQMAMKQACNQANINAPDYIIAHAPGTKKGDNAEFNAIKSVFGHENSIPISSNKHITGHTLGASGMISIAQAIAALNGKYLDIPYPTIGQNIPNEKPKHVLINATGFGGNAISIIIAKS